MYSFCRLFQHPENYEKQHFVFLLERLVDDGVRYVIDAAIKDWCVIRIGGDGQIGICGGGILSKHGTFLSRRSPQGEDGSPD